MISNTGNKSKHFSLNSQDFRDQIQSVGYLQCLRWLLFATLSLWVIIIPIVSMSFGRFFGIYPRTTVRNVKTLAYVFNIISNSISNPSRQYFQSLYL